ncbi:NAD(P)/FAD-dependent oxidoreductase [bacterium]|nr:NAD(P)/FAD-dependent oxidoreductase [bacterium]
MSLTPNPDWTALYDVTIVGGGPAGLSAALILGRARKRVLLLDAGTPRNARAHEVHGFVTRDGTPPAEFRRLAHEQLAAYPSVARASQLVERITGEVDAFHLQLQEGTSVRSRRILLALGMVDVLPELPGYRELWGSSLFQCPYCHAWEEQDKAFGFLAPGPEKLEFGAFLLGWTPDVTVFTDARFEVPSAIRDRLEATGVRLEERPIRRLVARPGDDVHGDRLEAVELVDGTRIAREVLFVRPPQRQTALVEAMTLALDQNGFVQVDARQETSCRGIFAAGDLTTQMQSAMIAAAAGYQAAAMLNHDLTFGPQ